MQMGAGAYLVLAPLAFFGLGPGFDAVIGRLRSGNGHRLYYRKAEKHMSCNNNKGYIKSGGKTGAR